MTGREKVRGEGIDLLILQPTPFCNIDCDYCYLSSRSSTKRLAPATLRAALTKVLASGLVQGPLSVVWHAGEPLALPLAFYEEAFAVIASVVGGDQEVSHSIQTNATLVNDRWCRFIRQHQVKIGVSLDGPAFLHDAHRRDRRGKGTHARVMAGVKCLQANDVPFHVIAVITAQALGHPDEVMEFFLEHGIRNVGFNIEELEGTHGESTLTAPAHRQAVLAFLRRVYEYHCAANGAIRVREFDRAYQAIATADVGSSTAAKTANDQVRPFGIVSIDCDGNLSTFSPELLGARSPQFGNFLFGNVNQVDLADVLIHPVFREVANEIATGVELCSRSCEYFPFCGGGAPSNKYFENGTFASTETMYCRYVIKAPLDIVLADLERSLSLAH